jgi:hypothetical protein
VHCKGEKNGKLELGVELLSGDAEQCNEAGMRKFFELDWFDFGE